MAAREASFVGDTVPLGFGIDGEGGFVGLQEALGQGAVGPADLDNCLCRSASAFWECEIDRRT